MHNNKYEIEDFNILEVIFLKGTWNRIQTMKLMDVLKNLTKMKNNNFDAIPLYILNPI